MKSFKTRHFDAALHFDLDVIICHLEAQMILSSSISSVLVW